jgi:phage-related minor tail protein
MDAHTPAEDLPSLYRAILDRIAALEAAGQRSDAVRIRRDATRAYSRAWDERARRELEALLRRASTPTAAERLLGRGRRADRRPGRGRPIVPAHDV